MTTHQPPSQPGYLARLAEIGAALHDAFARLNALLDDGPRGDIGWTDRYRAHTALALACSLVDDAKDRERERCAPVPFLPVEPAAQAHLRAILDAVVGALPVEAGALPVEVIEQASALIAVAIETGTPLTVEGWDGQ